MIIIDNILDINYNDLQKLQELEREKRFIFSNMLPKNN